MRGTAVLLTACLLLTGCSARPAGREMGDMALLRTMGVDILPDGLAVTVSTGPRARGLQGEQDPALVLSAAAPSISGACLAMEALSDSFIFYGYVDQLLLGEGLARRDIRPVLDHFAQDRELGLDSQLWLVGGGTAAQALASGGDQGVDRRLSTLSTDGRLGVAAIPRTVGQVYTDLLEQGASYGPVLLAGEGGLSQGGYALLRDFALVGVLTGEDARGLELLAGRVAAEIVQVPLGEGSVPVELRSAHTRPSLEVEDGRPRGLKVDCRLTARVAQGAAELSREELEQLRKQVARRVQARLAGALGTLQAFQADCLGLGARAALAHPVVWQRAQGDWPRIFSQIDTQIAVQVDLHR